MDYTIYYKTSFENGRLDTTDRYDLFFSAYDNCERTKKIFGKIKADTKFWINFPHYNNKKLRIKNLYTCESYKEDECFQNLFSRINISPNSKICIDTTGFIRPHLVFFIISLHRLGVKKLDFLYSEPNYYEQAEDTNFSGLADAPRLVEGCGSANVNSDVSKDLLIVTAGYDDKLISSISKYKSKIAKQYYILGLPSLQADMYQESIYKVFLAKDSIGQKTDRYAPAFDPFVTAQVINDIITENKESSNIYLSPLSTKPHTLGIVLYYLWNYRTEPLNIIFPFSTFYKMNTAIGIKKTWKYTFELP